MTTEEKLQHFLDFCMEDASSRSTKMLEEYTSALEKTFEEHKADTIRRSNMQLEIERENIEREINKQLSIEQINLKRVLGQKQEELKDMLFVELKDMLEHYMETSDYQKLLEHQIEKAKEFAGEEELVIYMDPVDENKLQRTALHQNVQLKISEYSFMGGIRAVIPSKNILIDDSFQTKLDEAKHNFRFELDIELGGNTNG